MTFCANKILVRLFVISLFLVVPIIAFAQAPCQAGVADGRLCDGFGGATTGLPALAQKVFAFVAEVIGLAAITVMVYSGARMITAQGNPDTIKTAKAGFTWSIVGFVIAISAFVIVVAISNFIGVGNVDQNMRALQNPLSNATLQGFAGTILNRFGAVVGLLAVLMILLNGFRYVTAGGNEDTTAKAKSELLWSVVGLAGVALAYVIIRAVAALLN